MQRVSSYSPMQFLITGVDKESLDTETYSKEKVENAQRAIQEAGINKLKEQEEKKAEEDDDDWGEEIDDEEIPF